MTDLDYMELAIEQAKIAASLGEVPVGAVIVKNDSIVATAYNRRELDKNALAHAELLAIDRACKRLGGWRLFGCTLYVTLEPCPMCAGAIINARIPKVYYGAKDDKNGACGSVVNLFEQSFTHKPELVTGILEADCTKVLQDFFVWLREDLKNRPKWKKPASNP